MKKIILLTIAMFCATVCGAQNQNNKETIELNFQGINFSAVNVIGAAETEAKLITAFAGINQLLISEPLKYDVGKLLGLNITSLETEHTINQLDNLKGVKFKDKKESAVVLQELIESYPTTQGDILLIVAKELNKSTNTGIFIAVIFNGENKQIISEQEFRGKAGGFGLRNFWAGALYNGLKSFGY